MIMPFLLSNQATSLGPPSCSSLLFCEWSFPTLYSKTNVSLEGPDYQLGMENQRDLFWWGSPHLVISLIQFMNFGYALSLAIVIMYWPYLTGSVEDYWYAASIFVCYGVFLHILGLVLPQYTLCTSLGYLTNKKELQETVAMHRLEEMGTQQKRRQLIQIVNQQKDPLIVPATTIQEPIVLQRRSLDSQNNSLAVVISADGLERQSDWKPLVLADLVKAGTDTLRTQLPEASRESLLAREQRVQERRANRKKALSEGVSTMRGMAPLGFHATANFLAEKMKKADQEKRSSASSRPTHRLRKSSSQPIVIQGWQDLMSQEDDAEKKPSRTRRKSSSNPGVIKGWQDIISHSGRDDEKAAVMRSKDDSDALRLFEREGRRKNISAYARVRASQDSGAGPDTVESGGCQDQKTDTITKAPPMEESNVEDPMYSMKNDRPMRLTRSRHARKKSVSDSAVIQSWQDFSVSYQQGGLTHTMNDIGDERYVSNRLVGFSCGDNLDDYRITRNSKMIYVPAARGYRSDHLTMLSRVEDDLDFHPLKETEREYECDGTMRTMAISKAADLVFIQGLDSFRDVSKKRSDNEVDDDSNTVLTDKSIGGLSDVDIMQTVRGIFPIADTEIVPWHTRFLVLLTTYFKGSTYRPLSHIFGTMVVFFFIGFRVEAMIAKTGVFFEPDSAWGSSLMLGFWFEASWLICFVLLDVAILTLLPFAKCESRDDRCLNVAAIVDVFLSGMTMTLLFVAESRRCCYDEPDQRRISGLVESDPIQRELAPDYEFEYQCTCPFWGRRTYTGLGVIEPFTSLIALRVFRFHFATLLVKHMDKRHSKQKKDGDSSADIDKDDPPSHDSHCAGHGDGRNMHDTGTLLEHWERAISEFPDIVEKYGQFSGELLQAMLGLHVDFVSSDFSASLKADSKDNQNGNEKQKQEDDEKGDTGQSHIRLAGTQYMHLSAEAQGLIIAGSLGKPVKVVHNGDLTNRVHADCDDVEHPRTAKLVLAEFEVDSHKMSVERNTDYSFVAPFASLVRSMRRCDRKLVPLLTTWVSVDVVMTQFEIVYFEAVDDNSCDDEHLRHHVDSCRSALRATKGGKGLRLCDVALGRKVVGQLDLSRVTEVHVEQDVDVFSDSSTLEKVAVLLGDKNDMASEYWYDSQMHQAGNHEYPRAVRWLTMHEERLKLTTEAGTLHLRFYADLAYAEAELNNSLCHDMSTLKKEVAFQWAESVVRIVGPQQLYKQKLPHFGEGNEEELHDYLEINHFHEKELASARKEMGDLFPDLSKIGGLLPDQMSGSLHRGSTTSSERVRFHQRSKSFGEVASERENPKRPPVKPLRRLLSLGLSERGGMPTQSQINSDLNTGDAPKNLPNELGKDKQLKWLAMSPPPTNPDSATDTNANPTASQKRNVSWQLQHSSSSLLVNPLRTGTSFANEHALDSTVAAGEAVDLAENV